MKIKIYQVNMERDTDRVAFESLENLQAFHGSAEVDSSIYDKVYEGNVDCSGLEDVFQMFNLDHPEGYRGRSLSVSDVVEVVDGVPQRAIYGFHRLYRCAGSSEGTGHRV